MTAFLEKIALFVAALALCATVSACTQPGAELGKLPTTPTAVSAPASGSFGSIIDEM